MPTPESQVVQCNPNELVVSLRQVARYAGGIRYRMDAPRRDTADMILKNAMQLVHPTFVYSVHDSEEVATRGEAKVGGQVTFHQLEFFRDDRVKNVAVCVCSIGRQLENEVQRLINEQTALRGILLDAIGVAFLDALSTAAYTHAQIRAEQRRLHCSCRFGPGCGDLDLSLQKQVFALVDASSIDVHLNDDCVMTPAKSLSFFTAWTSAPLSAADLDKCASCTFVGCDYRQQSFRASVGPSKRH
jgi:hypothetical protein